MTRWGRVGLLGLAVLSAGCQDAGLEALERRLEAWRVDAVAPARQALPAAPEEEVISYRFADAPSPFAVPESGEGRADVGEVASREVSRTPLEDLTIEALNLVGILRIADEAWALVRTPEGRVHRVGVGARLGRHRGRIVAIGEAEVRLVVRHPDGNGDWSERDVTLALDS